MSDAPAEGQLQQSQNPPPVASPNIAAQLDRLTNRPGWKTTEFYMILFGVIVIQAIAEQKFAPEWLATILTAAMSIGYAFIRTAHKTEQQQVIADLLLEQARQPAAAPAFSQPAIGLRADEK